MVVMFTFVGGIRLFLDKMAAWMAEFRNHWAYVRYVAETVRRCANFFWFRFFLNYKISLQGKVGGQLRAQKKIFRRGTISVEDRASTIAYHKVFANTKFGVFNLSFWLQFKVPSIVESFEGHELVSTMQILLSRYNIPWLGQRLSYVVNSIDRDERLRKAYSKPKKRQLIKRFVTVPQYRVQKRKEVRAAIDAMRSGPAQVGV